MKVKSITYLNENKKSKRELKVKLDNGTTIRIGACYESWQQWGGTTEELYVTMPIAESHNEWLHGGERPYESDDD